MLYNPTELSHIWHHLLDSNYGCDPLPIRFSFVNRLVCPAGYWRRNEAIHLYLLLLEISGQRTRICYLEHFRMANSKIMFSVCAGHLTSLHLWRECSHSPLYRQGSMRSLTSSPPELTDVVVPTVNWPWSLCLLLGILKTLLDVGHWETKYLRPWFHLSQSAVAKKHE